MTKRNDKKEQVSIDESDDEKTAKIAEKLETMGVTPSNKNEPEKKSGFISPLLITLLLAIPVAGYILYLNMPDQFNKWTSVFHFSSNSDKSVTETTTSESDQSQLLNDSEVTVAEATPVDPESNNTILSRMMAAIKTEDGQSEAGSQEQAQADEWLAAQQKDMEKRRAEYNKKHPQPEWVNKQRADMEKRRLAFQQSSAEAYKSRLQRPELPQWVKDRQAEMEKQRAQYNQVMSNNAMQNNRPPIHMQQPVMNPYQQNNAAMNNRMPPRFNPMNAYQQRPRPYYYPPNPYYNTRYNGYRPYNPNFGRNGYPY